MPYRKIQFINDGYYHILNHGIDGRNIFMDETDYDRFLESLKEFNTTEITTIQSCRYYRNRIPKQPTIPFQPLVKILCYCLMPNHFHLLLKQLAESSIREFMRKIGAGYANYFNLKYERRGHLFEGAFTAVPILKENQFLHISRYIHLNALDLFEPCWRDGKINDWEKTKKILENYPWSSYSIFIGKRAADFCHPELLGEIFQKPDDYENFVKDWSTRELQKIGTLVLE